MSADSAPSGRDVRWWSIRLLGIGAVIFFGCIVFRYWNPAYGFTAFLQIDHSYDTKKIEAFREQPVYVYPELGAYDAVAYSQIAYHPLLNSDELRPAVDNLSYRARRILPPALAWILAAGQPALIVQVYCCLNLIAWLILAAVLWHLLPVENWRGAIAWAGVLFSAGALISVRRALPDLIGLAILALAMLALERGRRGRAIAWLAAASLTRETSLTALPGFWTSPWLSRANFKCTLLAVLPLAGWLVYVHWKVGPQNAGVDNFGWPAIGLISKWRDMVKGTTEGHSDPLLFWATFLATFSLTVQAAFMLRFRAHDSWWQIGAANVVLLLLLGHAVWEGVPGAAGRVVLPLTLAFNILAYRQRTGLFWLIAGNLSVVAGVAAMSDHPFSRDFLAGRDGSKAWVVREGNGWFACEFPKWHLRAWSGGDAQIDIVTWPRKPLTLKIGFLLGSIAPRTVAISENGHELWQGAVNRTGSHVSIQIRTAADGLAEVQFATDAPAVLENNQPNARRLAFEIYDPKLLSGP
jgi:hypothetical protein